MLTSPPMARRCAEDRIPFSATAQPLTIRGTRYPSQCAAARAVGVTQGAIWQALQKGQAALDAVAAGNKRRPRAVVIDGTRYPSAAAAARATGIPYSAAIGMAKEQEARNAQK